MYKKEAAYWGATEILSVKCYTDDKDEADYHLQEEDLFSIKELFIMTTKLLAM